MVFVVMGVAGSGKTAVGRMLAQRLAIPFYDADDLHPDENIRKMERGVPLGDDDRAPWLGILADRIRQWDKEGDAVLACSALKNAYRRALSDKSKADIRLIYLKGDIETIRLRMKGRKGHFMPPGLLESQFADLEEPAGAITVSIDMKPEEIVDSIIAGL